MTKGKDISEFVSGEIITRVTPSIGSILKSPLVEGDQEYRDSSLIGVKLMYLGKDETHIQVSNETPWMKNFYSEEERKLNLNIDDYQKGWDYVDRNEINICIPEEKISKDLVSKNYQFIEGHNSETQGPKKQWEIIQNPTLSHKLCNFANEDYFNTPN